MTNAPKLFSQSDLGDLLRASERMSQEHVDALSADQILSLSEDQVVEHVVAKMRFEPIELQEEERELEQRETKTEVSSDPRRFIFPGSGLVFVPAHEVQVSIPFTGNADF